MQDELAVILETLKSNGWPAYKIEKQLNLSNGVLGKTVSGKKAISAENFKLVVDFYSQIIKTVPASAKTQLFSLSDLSEADLELIPQYLEVRTKWNAAIKEKDALSAELKASKEAQKTHFDPYAKLPWAAEIEHYCARNGLQPDAFVSDHKRLKEVIKNHESMISFYRMAIGQKIESGEIPKEKANFMEEMRKKKLGY